MSANLAMNPAAVLTNRRHLNAQRLTNATATVAQTNQGDQGNLTGCEPIFLGENTNPATMRTRRLPSPCLRENF
jgi:hypothetical protein